MSDDLVKRLREVAEATGPNDARQVALDAADRISDLEAKLATCEKYRDAYDKMGRIGTEAYRDLEAKLAKAVEERDEAIRRRDAWKSKAEGYDAVRKALREKVGAPWPPNLSRALWAGIAADEKKRADDAEAKLAKAVEVGNKMAHSIEGNYYLPGVVKEWRTTLAELKGEK